MKLKFALAILGVIVLAAVLFPPVLYIALGVLAMWLVGVIYHVKSGLTSEGQQKLKRAEQQRRAQGIALQEAALQREAARLAAIDQVKEQLRAEQ
jgi:uncharacterized membrane protein YciS (DUF1049 family)